MHNRVGALAAEIAIVGYITRPIGESFYLNDITFQRRELLDSIVQLGLLILAQSALTESKINRRGTDELVIVEVLNGVIQLCAGLLSQSVRGLSLLCGGYGGSIRLGGRRGGLGGLLPCLSGLLVGGCYLSVKIPDRLVRLGLIVVGLFLQSAQLSLGLIDLILNRRNGFADMLLRSAPYAHKRQN